MSNGQIPAYSYNVFGLNIQCELSAAQLFGLAHITNCTPDAVICMGEVPYELESPIYKDANISYSTGCILLKIKGIANYLIRNGKEIVIDAMPGAKEGDVATYTFGSALGALLYQRGILALHGSAVRTKKGAVIFSGTRGIGKSTTAAALSLKGWEFMSDDVCAVHIQDDRPVLHPGLSRAKLAADSFSNILGHCPDSPPVSPVMKKYGVPFETDCRPSSLYAICTLETTSGSPYIEQISGIERMSTLTKHIYRPLMYHLTKSAQARFMQYSIVSSNTVFMRVFRSPDYGRISELIQLLEADVLG